MPENYFDYTIPKEYDEWLTYHKKGGNLNYTQWKSQWGKQIVDWFKAQSSGVSPKAKPQGIITVPPTPMATPTITAQATELEQAAHANYVTFGGNLSIDEWLKEGKPLPTEERFTGKTIVREGWVVPIYKDVRGNEYENWAEARQQATQQAPTGYAQPIGVIPKDPYGRTATWDAQGAQWQYPPDWGNDPAMQKAGYMTPYQQQQLALQTQQQTESERQGQFEQQYQQQLLGFQQQQLAQQQATEQSRLAAEKEARLATLRANPASWLEYASLSGQTPTIQPWMLPLMPQQYSQFQAGQQLPGYQANETTMNLPELTRPSTQYLARSTPSAVQQYYGYEKARTGATPEDTQRRIRSGSAPGGYFSGLRWLR